METNFNTWQKSKQPYQKSIVGELDIFRLSEVDVVHQQRPGVQLHEDSD